MSTLPTKGRERLIVVEDDPVTRAMVAGYFIDHGFEVVEAGTAAECRQALKRRNADLVFIDVQLPDSDGFDLAKEVQAMSAAGIIFVTRRNSEVDRIVGLETTGFKRNVDGGSQPPKWRHCHPWRCRSGCAKLRASQSPGGPHGL